MENTDQTGTGETEDETRGAGKKTSSPARKEEANGKIGPNGYNRSVENIRHDLDRFEKEHHKLREDIQKTLSLVELILPKSAPGDLSAFVDRGLMDPILPPSALPDRNAIARTWEEGKRIVEELDAFYSRLRTQKIWSQEDLEGILTRLESVGQEIAGRVGDLQKIDTSDEARGTGKSPDAKVLEAIASLAGEIAGLGKSVAESRQAILEAIASRPEFPERDRSCSFDPNVFSPLIGKIGDLEGQIRGNRPTPLPDASRDTGSAALDSGGAAQGLRTSLFARSSPETTGKKALPPRIKKMGFIGAMAVLAIVAVVARAKHAGPPPEPTKTVAIREALPSRQALPQEGTVPPSPLPTFQSFAPILTGLDRLHAKESENGRAIADLSQKIDKVLAPSPKKAVLTAKEKRLIGEGRELEWLVKTWPTGPGRKELLRMMGSYAGE